MALQLRRGTNAERLLITPVEGEIIYVTDWELVQITGTTIDGLTDTITFNAAHGLSTGDQVLFQSATQLGLTEGTSYYVISAGLTTTACRLSTTPGGFAVDLTTGTGLTLTFAKTPTTAAGVPVGTNVPPLWVGDGTTVGGAAAVITNLDDLYDVGITSPTEGQTLYYDATTSKWKNNSQLIVNDTTNTIGINASGGLTTNQTTFNLVNTTATTVNFAGDATNVNIGATANASATSIRSTTLNINSSPANGERYSNLFFYGKNLSNVEGNAYLSYDAELDTLAFYVSTGGYYFNNGPVITDGALTVGTNLTVNGDLTVSGATTNLDTTNLTIKDNLILLNNGEAGNGVTEGTAGIEIDRGGFADVQIRWNESTDRWQTTVDGSNYLDIPNQALDIISIPTFGAAYISNLELGIGVANRIRTKSGAGDLILSGDPSGSDVVNITGRLDLGGDLKLVGNDIISSTGAVAITLSGADVAIAGDLTVTGNDIKSSTATALTLSGADVAVAGDLTVTGNDIKSSGGTTALTLSGANVTVAGNLTVNGTTTTINSTVVTIDDPIFTLGGDTAPTIDDGKDRGIEFRWYDTQARTGFFGFDRSTGKFTFIPDATNSSEVFSGTKGGFDIGNITAGNVQIAVTGTNEIDTSSGNLTIDSAGGTTTVDDELIVSGDLTVQGNTIKSSTADAISLLGANVTIEGDLFVAGNGVYSQGGYQVFEFTQTDVEVKGDLTVTGNDIIITHGAVTSDTLTTSATTADQVLLTAAAATFRTVKATVSITSGSAYQAVEILVMHDGTNAYFTTYADIKSGANLATFNADVSGGNLRLLTTPVNAVTTYKVVRHAVEV